MNRLESPTKQNPSNQTTDFTYDDFLSLADPVCREPLSVGAHTLFAPLHYESGYDYPLIVWLHGPGDDEHQLQRIMPLVSLRNFAAIAPRGTYLQDDSDCATSGCRWDQHPDHVFLAEQRVLACVDEASRRLSIHPRRVFIGGFQCGGTMALRVALSHPERFAGALTFGGPMPQGMAPLRRVSEARHLPVFVACGRESQQYSQPALCADLRLLYAAGMSVTMRLYPCGDEMITNMLSDMNGWIMEAVGSRQ